jgi:hypothetical protein
MNRLRVKAGKFEDTMNGREECRILTECWTAKKKNKEKKERDRNTVRSKKHKIRVGCDQKLQLAIR